MTDDEVDALLVALHRDLSSEDAELVVDAQDAGDDVDEAYQRFLKRPLLKNATTGEYELADGDGRNVGEFVRAFRADEATAAFAGRFGITAPQLAALESCTVELKLDELDAVAKTAASDIVLPPLKVLRLLKAAAAKATTASASEEPLLLAARRRPGARA